MLMKCTHTPARRTHGFSLIEVMVAVVVICVGLLGIAKMQAMAVSTTNMSRQRSLAAIEAASFAAAMHTNREYWGNFAVPFNVTVSNTPNVAVASSDPALQAQTTNDLAALGACVAVNNGPACNVPVNLAAYDLARWWTSVSQLLPSPLTVNVNCPGTTPANPQPVSCTITITWFEKSVAMNANEAAQEAAAHPAGTASSLSEQPVFTLYVEP
jgi:type IV pilus assembly protein PilV